MEGEIISILCRRFSLTLCKISRLMLESQQMQQRKFKLENPKTSPGLLLLAGSFNATSWFRANPMKMREVACNARSSLAALQH